MVQHGEWYYLITSRGDYGDCRYRTIWRRSHFRHQDWQGTRGHALLNRRNTGVCGPGGADYVPRPTTAANRLFFHGWVCKGTNLPCYQCYQGGTGLRGRRQARAVRRPVARGRRTDPSLSAFVQGPEPVAGRRPRPRRRRRRPPPTPTVTPTETPTPTDRSTPTTTAPTTTAHHLDDRRLRPSPPTP